MEHEVTYLGGIAEIGPYEKWIQHKITRFMETTELEEIDGTYLVDVNNLFRRKFMCCPENCDFYIHHKQSGKKLFGEKAEVDWVDKGCCFEGSLEIPAELIERIDNDIDEIVKICDEDCRNHILKKGWKKKITKDLIGVNYLPKDRRCLFTFIGDDGMPMCALHRHALNKGVDVLEYKPFECFLYPLEIMEIDGKILITSIDGNGSTQGFVRWGDVHLAQKCQHSTVHGLPMYEYAKDVIVNVLGEKVYNAMDKIYKEKYYEEKSE